MNLFPKTMCPENVSSRYTLHGLKYEHVTIHEYQKYMNIINVPVLVLKCGFVPFFKKPMLGCSPDGNVIDCGCTEPYGLIEVPSHVCICYPNGCMCTSKLLL